MQHIPADTMPRPLLCKGLCDEDTDRSAAVDDELDDGEGGIRLICAACGAEVTSTGARTERGGEHRHVFCNPAGFVYEIGCFSKAPGCGAVGTPSTEFAWFPGHAWQVGVCRSCQVHLGWRFRSGSGGFYGLILDRLAEETTPSS